MPDRKPPEEESITKVFEEILLDFSMVLYAPGSAGEIARDAGVCTFADKRGRPKKIEIARSSLAFERLEKIYRGRTDLLDPDITDEIEWERLVAQYGKKISTSGGYIDLTDRTVAKIEVFHILFSGPQASAMIAVVLLKHFGERELDEEFKAHAGRVSRLRKADRMRLVDFVKQL